MGAKQSKRSVEIAGGAGGAEEVAGGGAGGEGRLEPLADVDALKPHANGDAHAHADAAGAAPVADDAVKEEKAQDVKEGEKTESADGAAGDAEKPKEPEAAADGAEPGAEAAPAQAPDDTKKPKKEKGKRKWSLRSISFSRKEKPKQEKKQKDEETKANGEPEKVLEEAIEATVDTVVAEEKPESENKEQKTPETPVTEPITNGSSTPGSSKVESPAAEKPITISSVTEKLESKVVVSSENLPINGLSLEETKKEITEVITKIEETVITTITETAEPAPVPEKSIKSEETPGEIIAEVTKIETQEVPIANSHIPQQMSVDSESSVSNEESKNAEPVSINYAAVAKSNGSVEAEVNSLIEDLPLPKEDLAENQLSMSQNAGNKAENAQNNKSEESSILNINSKLLLDNAYNDATNDANIDALQEKLSKKTKDSLGNIIVNAEFNGNVDRELTNGVGKQTDMSNEDVSPPSLVEDGNSEASDSFPPPPSDLAADAQETHPISKKGAELLQDMSSVPDFTTDKMQEASSDVVVAN